MAGEVLLQWANEQRVQAIVTARAPRTSESVPADTAPIAPGDSWQARAMHMVGLGQSPIRRMSDEEYTNRLRTQIAAIEEELARRDREPPQHGPR